MIALCCFDLTLSRLKEVTDLKKATNDSESVM